jgi:acyl-CoA synthetase (AMP-forming)/AMP-acid ligase II
MKRAIKPLKYILLFKGCFIACVIALAVFAYSVCWGVSLLGQQAEHGKQYIYSKAQAVVIAAGSRLGVIHTEEEQQAAIEQQVYAVLSKEEQNTITKDAFEEMQTSLAPLPAKKPKVEKKAKPSLPSNALAQYRVTGDPIGDLITQTTGGK